MSLRIRVICTQSVGQIGVGDFRRASEAADFVTWAENQGLAAEFGNAAKQALRFDAPPGEFKTARLSYGGGAESIAIERRAGEAAQGELKALRQEFEGVADSAAERIRLVLGQAVELVLFELKQEDALGMGRPISWQTAMWLGNLGKGLVDANGEWWDPASYELIRSSLGEL